MDINTLLKLYAAKGTFQANHPKFVAFIKSLKSRPLTEGTVVELTITRPGEAPVSANLKVQASDLALLQSLLELLHHEG